MTANTSTTTSRSSRQYSLRGLLVLTFLLSALLSIYRHLPAGSIPWMIAGLASLYLVFVLIGGIACLVEVFRSILRKIR